jgi:hypothetical protein
MVTRPVLLGNPQMDRVSYRSERFMRTAIGRSSYGQERTL